MGLFGPIQTVDEKCSCGATFAARGPLSTSAAFDWRIYHRCRTRKPATAAADAGGHVQADSEGTA